MKILLAGATFNSNFGDLLFSHLFYDKCKEAGFDEISFWQLPQGHAMCDFCRNELDYHKKVSLWKAIRHDVLIVYSGGMWGEPGFTRRGTVKRFLRFILPALVFTLLRKPVYILGAGGGPLFTWPMRKMARYIWNHARRITVRNVETRDYYKSIGVTRDIELTSDTAQVITQHSLPPFQEEQTLNAFLAGRRFILLQLSHPNTGDRQMTAMLPAVKEFAQVHPEYAIVVTTDKAEHVEKLRSLMASEHGIYLHDYHDSWQLASLINLAAVVVTPTLHVGIVAASLGKSVLSFAGFYEKTHRYYDQIGESDRCLKINTINKDIVLSLLEKFHDKPIVLSPTIRNLAQKNLDIINEIPR